LQDDIAEKISFLERFKADIRARFNGDSDDGLRTRISRSMPRAKSILSDAGVLKTVTLSPPPAIGGLIVRNGDPFSFILQDYYGMSMIPAVADMIEEAIGVLESPEYQQKGLLPKASLVEASDAVADTDHLANAAARQVPGRSKNKSLPELPEKVTLSWLVQHVPISFWFWLVGLLAAAFAAGAKIGPLLVR
jgi:hypothetical protein